MVSSDSFAPIVAKGVGTIVAFGLSIVLARTLGINTFGQYTLVISVLTVLSIPVQAGLPTLGVRETSKARAKSDNSTITTYIKWSNKLIAGYSIVITIFCVLFFLIATRWGKQVFAYNLLVGAASIFIVSKMLRNNAVMRGLGRYTAGIASDILIRPSVHLCLFVVVASLIDINASGSVVIYTVSAFIAYAASSIMMRSSIKGFAAQHQHRPEVWMKALWLLTIVGGGQIFFGNIETLMLGLFTDSAQVGAYRVAVQISMLIILILTVINQVLQPKFSALYVSGDIAGLENLALKSSWEMFLAVLLPGAVLLAFADPFLGIVFSDEYRIAAVALQILVVGQCINVFFGSVGTLLNMTGFEKESSKGMIIAITINIALNLILIPTFGLNGAALSSMLSIFFWNLILRHYVKTRVGIESSGAINKITTLLKKEMGPKL
jgi:O-antigen/teichoic acid export membrane protein